MSAVDLPRLRATLGAPRLARVVDALRKRIELGRPLTGSLALPRVSTEERSAIDELLGRTSTRGDSLQLNLDLLSDSLRQAGICVDLFTAVEALCGRVIDRRALAQTRRTTWAAVWQESRVAFGSHPALLAWLGELSRSGLTKRLCGDDPDVASIVLRETARVLRALPAKAEPLAAFAARLFGDAHALDPGTPRATLAVRAAARLGDVEFEDDAEGRRAAWASVGVMCDELSTPALVFNLPTSQDTPLARLLRSAQADIEPLHISLRLLLRWPLDRDPALADRNIFVCENPTIVALAVAQAGPHCAPLVCVNGQFATPSLVLLRQLRAAGAHLHYHGDFDPAGLAIARRVISESEASPWRFGVVDYIAAPKGVRFAGDPGPTPWSPALVEAMRENGRVVHEEAIFETLVRDLAGDTHSVQ